MVSCCNKKNENCNCASDNNLHRIKYPYFWGTCVPLKIWKGVAVESRITQAQMLIDILRGTEHTGREVRKQLNHQVF